MFKWFSGVSSSQPRLEFEIRTASFDQNGKPIPAYKPGERRGNAVYCPFGRHEVPELETIVFPDPGHVEPYPQIGMLATAWSRPIFRAAMVTKVGNNGATIYARLEYKWGERIYTLRKDKTYRLQRDRGPKAERLVLGVKRSNIIYFKKWWSDSDLEAGRID